MTQIKQEIFNEMRKLNLLVSEKHKKNYAKTKRYKHVEDDIFEKYLRLKNQK